MGEVLPLIGRITLRAIEPEELDEAEFIRREIARRAQQLVALTGAASAAEHFEWVLGVLRRATPEPPRPAA